MFKCRDEPVEMKKYTSRHTKPSKLARPSLSHSFRTEEKEKKRKENEIKKKKEKEIAALALWEDVVAICVAIAGRMNQQ